MSSPGDENRVKVKAMRTIARNVDKYRERQRAQKQKALAERRGFNELIEAIDTALPIHDEL